MKLSKRTPHDKDCGMFKVCICTCYVKQIAQLEAENVAAFELLDVYEKENERLREYYEAHMAVENSITEFDLHWDAVERLKNARDALKEGKDD